MAGNNQYKAGQFIEAIKGSGGIISTIARKVGCDWHTAKKYITNYPTVQQAYDDECERVLDAAETTIISDIIEKKEVQTAKWYLGMKGAERGYAQTKKSERTVKKVDLSKLTDVQLERLANGDDVYTVLANAGGGNA